MAPIRDLEQLDGKIYRWTLCFKEAGVERGFLHSRHERLAKNLFLCCGLVTLYNTFALVIVSFDWSTSGAQFVATEDVQPAALARNLQIATVIVICVAFMLIARCGPLRRALGFAGLEIFAIAGVVCIIVFITGSCPWYLARLYGLDAPDVVRHKASHDDANLLLMLDAFITAVHLALPIRWIVLWPAEVAVVLCYTGAALSLGSPMPLDTVVMNVVMMLVLTLAAALGRRTIEFHERASFSRLAAEKTLRFQLEHKLEKFAGAEGGRAAKPEDIASSVPTTTHTGEIFGSLDGLSPEEMDERLQQIADIGYSEHWLVPATALEVRLSEILGRGGFGLVVAAAFHGAPVALKVPLAPPGASAVLGMRGISAVAHELRMYRRLRHPNIALFYGCCFAGEPILVMERVRGLPLDEFVVPGPPAGPPTAVRVELAVDASCALRYLHGQHPTIVHGDIKGNNILVEQLAGGGANAKLIDFGLSRILTRHAKPLGGTLRWMAPEVLLHSGKPAPSSDIFSFGRVLYMIVAGQKPLAGVQEVDFVLAAREGRSLDIAWPPATPLSTECKRLADACVRIEPAARPSAVEIHGALRTLLDPAEAQSGSLSVGALIAQARGSSAGTAGAGAALRDASGEGQVGSSNNNNNKNSNSESGGGSAALPIQWGGLGLPACASSSLLAATVDPTPRVESAAAPEVVEPLAPQSSSSSTAN